MKKNIFETIKHDIHLTTEEKSVIRGFVMSYIKQNPLTSDYTQPFTGYTSMQAFFLSIIEQKRLVLALVLLLLIGGGATSVFAQNALPGDSLYPVKIHINEQVESLLALGPKNNAEVDAKQAERRLNEVETLVSQGKLNEKTSNELKNSFSQEIQSLNNNLANLEKEGKTTTASELRGKWEDQVNEHQKAFMLISDMATSTSKIETESDTHVTQTEKSQENDEEKSNVSNQKKEDVRKNSEQENTIHTQESESRDDNESGDDSEEGGDDSQSFQNISAPQPPTITKSFTLAQVAVHNTEQDCYTTVNGLVYDVTSFINQHPGGKQSILSLCGKDGSSSFTNQHGGQSGPEQELQSLKIGVLIK